jgi:hypothetical protein
MPGRLAKYKVPKALVLLGQLPTLPNEKIDKRRLQRLAAGGHDPDLQQLPAAARPCPGIAITAQRAGESMRPTMRSASWPSRRSRSGDKLSMTSWRTYAT